MAFYGKHFVFDSVPSDMYDVYVSNTDSGDVTLPSSSNVNIITQSLFRRYVPYFYGATQEEVLSFPLFISSPEEIIASVGSKISSWLFGKQEYKKLQIYQEDMLDVYFNCFLTAPQTRRAGNKIIGYDTTVVCDSPFAWMFPNVVTHTYATEIVNSDVTFTNKSDNSDYLYPETVITINGFGGDVTLTNTSDAGRIFSITGLSAGEVLTIDNDRGILTSSTGLLRLSTFNKNWFRFIQGKNSFNISGNVTSVVITSDFTRKIT